MPYHSEQDMRLDPRGREFLAQFEEPLFKQEANVNSREEALAVGNRAEALARREATAELLELMDVEAITPSNGLTIETRSIQSRPDGNTINLQIIRPDTREVLPCVYYIHGGAMMEGSCFWGNYRAWGKLIAHTGVCVVMVDFRNCLAASSALEVAPFPAGLNDCISGFHWTFDNAESLGIDAARILIAGESGGGNLAIATTLSLARSGESSRQLGLYALCPFIAGQWPQGELPSSSENEGILISVHNNHAAFAYGQAALEQRDPLAWPLFATPQDLAGFPPTMISVNECDPLRDEGVLFYRRLLSAGVRAQCRQVMGTFHANELFVPLFPDICRTTARDIRGWVDESSAIARG